MISLYFWHKPSPNFFLSAFFMGITILVRPPIAILLVIHTLLYLPWRFYHRLRQCILSILLALLLIVPLSIFLDTLGVQLLFPMPATFYHTWTFAPYQFLKFNVLYNVSEFYGSHPFHWYFTQGLPSVLGPFSVIWPWTLFHRHRFNVMVVSTLCLFSLLPHKELRFLMDFHPFLLIQVARGFSLLMQRKKRYSKLVSSLTLAMFSIHGLMALFFSTLHQRGMISAMSYSRHHPGSTFALTPCHSLLGYAHFGFDQYSLDGLSCDPPTLFSEPNEEQRFYQDIPKSLLEWNWSTRWKSGAAKYVVVFDSFWQSYQHVGVLRDYQECARFFNGYFIDDSRREGDVLILCNKSNTTMPQMS